MILFNLCGGPGSGKSTISYYLAYRLKKAGFRTELVGEAAREEHIYDSTPGSVAPPLMDNQVLLAGQQYERILRLQRHGFEAVISDSPMIQGTMYCKDHFYYNRLFDLCRQLELNFKTYNIFVNRKPGTYDPESRVQKTEFEAMRFDQEVRNIIPDIWESTEWGQESSLADKVLTILTKEKF